MTEKVTLKSEMKSLIMLTLGAVVFAFNKYDGENDFARKYEDFNKKYSV